MTAFSKLLIFLLLGSLALYARDDWLNPRVMNVNTLPPRSHSISYPDEVSARTLDFARSPRRLSLNGTWKFHLAPSPHRSLRTPDQSSPSI